MKRIILLVLAAALLLALPAGAEGNRLMEAADAGWVHDAVAAGDTLLLAGDETLYTWREGEEALTALKPDFQLDNPKGNGAGDAYLAEMTFFDDAGRLRGARLLRDADALAYSLQLFDAVLTDDGAVRAENAEALDLPGELEGQEWMDLRQIVARQDRLYALCEADRGTLLCAIDPQAPRSARVELVDSWECRLLAAKDGVLAACGFYDDPDMRTALYRVGGDASLEELCRLPASAYTFAADPESGAIYAVSEGRVCPIDPQTGALGEPVAALPLEPQYAVMLSGGRWYAAVAQSGGVAVLDTSGALDESALLTARTSFMNEWIRDAMMHVAVEHPEIMPVMLDENGTVLEDMMTHSPDTDVYILDVRYSRAYEALLNRGFMLPLDGSEALRALYDRIYPGIRPFISRDGVMTALPVSAGGVSMRVSERALSKMGLSLSDVPDSWPDFLDFVRDELAPRLDQLGENERFSYDGMTAEGFRYFLFESIMNDWAQANRAAGRVPDYEDERLVATLEKLDSLDYAALGLEESDEEGYGYGWSSDVDYLVQFSSDFTFSNYVPETGSPFALGFGDDLPGTYALDICAAFVNPFSPRAEAAVAFLEALADALPEATLYALCPDLTEPVKRPDWEKGAAFYEEEIARQQEALDTAEASEKQELEEMLEVLKREYETYESADMWIVSEAGLAQYRAIGNRLTVAMPTWFDKDATGEAWQLMEQYRDRLISAREFLAAVNKKARMMEMEEG